jgi:hypothetical protein
VSKLKIFFLNDRLEKFIGILEEKVLLNNLALWSIYPNHLKMRVSGYLSET